MEHFFEINSFLYFIFKDFVDEEIQQLLIHLADSVKHTFHKVLNPKWKEQQINLIKSWRNIAQRRFKDWGNYPNMLEELRIPEFVSKY
jgi:hypothetical protein